MKYSLIVPHFDDLHRLERLLSSIPVERSDLEVLIIDDCSPDIPALESFKKCWPLIRWFSTPINTGAGAARNIGLSHAKGTYLVFADSDDEFIPGAFDVFDASLEEEDELVYFLSEAIQEINGLPSNRVKRFNDLCHNYFNILSDKALSELKIGHVVPWAKIYAREYVKKIGMKFEETRVSNDVAFNVLLAVQAACVRVIPKNVYRVYRRAGSLTSNPDPLLFLERVRVQKRLANSLRYHNFSERPSGTGWILASPAFGLKVMCKTCCICIFSQMKVDVFRIFNISRWRRFFRMRIAEQNEKKSAK